MRKSSSPTLFFTHAEKNGLVFGDVYVSQLFPSYYVTCIPEFTAPHGPRGSIKRAYVSLQILLVPRDPNTSPYAKKDDGLGWSPSPKGKARYLGSMKPFSEGDWIHRVWHGFDVWLMQVYMYICIYIYYI